MLIRSLNENCVVSASAVVLATTIALGCTTAPRMSQMIPHLRSGQTGLEGAICLAEFTGGRPTRSWDRPWVDAPALRGAAAATLEEAGLDVLDCPAAPLRIEANIAAQAPGQLATHMGVSFFLKVDYRLLDGGHSVIWQREIRSYYELSAHESPTREELIKLCEEGAVRDNLVQLVNELKTLLAKPNSIAAP